MPEEAKVHIGNLPFRVTEDELRDRFEKYGPIEDVNIITDRDTGRAKGYAFVTFEHAEDAQDAIDGLHHTDLNGRSITVDKARPRDSGGRSRGGGRSFGGGGGRRYDGGGRRYDGGGRYDGSRGNRRYNGSYGGDSGGYGRDQGSRGSGRYGGGGGSYSDSYGY